MKVKIKNNKKKTRIASVPTNHNLLYVYNLPDALEYKILHT